MRRLPELERRRVATEATRAKFLGKAFDWKERNACIHLAAYQARRMGHRPPPVSRLRSALGAKKELARRGKASVIELFDDLFPRIAPAAMLTGDLAAVPGEGGLDAIFVCVGAGRFMGWREDAPELVVLVVDLGEIEAAWRL